MPINRLKELKQLILPKYPYKERLKLTNFSSRKILTSRAIQKLGISASVFGNELISDEQGQNTIINLYIVFGRVSTNVMVKGAFSHTLYSDTQFWNSLTRDFSASDISIDEFKQKYVKLLVQLSLGWGQGKVATAVSRANSTLGKKLAVSNITTKLHTRLQNDLLWILQEAATDNSIDLSTAVNSPIKADVFGDDYLDIEYQTVLEKQIKLLLQLHNISYTENDLNSLNIKMFRPNNNPLNPKSTINSEDSFVSTSGVPKHSGQNDSVEVLESSLYSDEGNQPHSTKPYQKNTGWFLEWAPAQSAGVIKVPIEVAYPDKLPVHNVLAIDDVAATERLDTYMTAIHYLPMSSSHMILLEDFIISRQPIIAKDITLGSRYTQKLTENFPQFSIRISALRFGDVHTRVINFLNAVTTYISNPRQYPGALYLYSAFTLDMPAMYRTLYRDRIYKKYEIIPLHVAKQANSRNNTMIDIVVTGMVVSHNENH